MMPAATRVAGPRRFAMFEATDLERGMDATTEVCEVLDGPAR